MSTRLEAPAEYWHHQHPEKFLHQTARSTPEHLEFVALQARPGEKQPELDALLIAAHRVTIFTRPHIALEFSDSSATTGYVEIPPERQMSPVYEKTPTSTIEPKPSLKDRLRTKVQNLKDAWAAKIHPSEPKILNSPQFTRIAELPGENPKDPPHIEVVTDQDATLVAITSPKAKNTFVSCIYSADIESAQASATGFEITDGKHQYRYSFSDSDQVLAEGFNRLKKSIPEIGRNRIAGLSPKAYMRDIVTGVLSLPTQIKDLNHFINEVQQHEHSTNHHSSLMLQARRDWMRQTAHA